MGRGDLSDEYWARLEPYLPTNRGRGGRWSCHRRVINGILFRLWASSAKYSKYRSATCPHSTTWSTPSWPSG
ncbi:transposase [Streptomyces sp. NPDC010273]|uniref:transposase n=1 Tax=Streptomyces sp. NPDC010273 TaxID=3364829 RepID=UPI0036E90144